MSNADAVFAIIVILLGVAFLDECEPQRKNVSHPWMALVVPREHVLPQASQRASQPRPDLHRERGRRLVGHRP
jgi:hypothetical protein